MGSNMELKDVGDIGNINARSTMACICLNPEAGRAEDVATNADLKKESCGTKVFLTIVFKSMT